MSFYKKTSKKDEITPMNQYSEKEVGKTPEKKYKDFQNGYIKLKAIIEKAPSIGIIGFNNEGEVIFCNSFSEKLLGIPESQIKGKNLNSILFSKTDELEFKKILENIFLKEKPLPLFEWSNFTKTKETKTISCSIFPVILPEQEPLGVIIATDVTEKNKAKEKIKKIGRQFEKFSKISSDILLIEDEKILYEYIAQSVSEISDFTRVLISYFIDKPPYRKIIAQKEVKNADLKRVKNIEMPREKYLKYFKNSLTVGNQSCYIPYYMKNILDSEAIIPSDKTYPDYKSNWHKDDVLLISIKDVKGKVIGIISVDDPKDCTIIIEETVRLLEIFANLISEPIQKRILDRKNIESERAYKEMLNNIKLGILRATTNGEILQANKSCLGLFGYNAEDNFFSLKTHDLYKNPDDVKKVIKHIESYNEIKNRQIHMKKKDGKLFWASITSSAIRDNSGRVKYYDNIIEDITHRKNLQEEIKRLSLTDELSGLFNRRYFNENLPREIFMAEKFKSSLALIMIDIDNFKSYNDTYNHLKGDEVIKRAGKIISQSIRKNAEDELTSKFKGNEFVPQDWASRFGGDEFVIILPGTDTPQAFEVAKRIKESFHEFTFRPEGKSVHKTMSMGIAYFSHYDRKLSKSVLSKQIDYEKIYLKLAVLADKALYKAKKTGKNKIIISKESPA